MQKIMPCGFGFLLSVFCNAKDGVFRRELGVKNYFLYKIFCKIVSTKTRIKKDFHTLFVQIFFSGTEPRLHFCYLAFNAENYAVWFWIFTSRFLQCNGRCFFEKFDFLLREPLKIAIFRDSLNLMLWIFELFADI